MLTQAKTNGFVIVNSYGISSKISEMLNTSFIRLIPPLVQKVKIYNTMWYVANWSCSCVIMPKDYVGKSGTKIISWVSF